MQSYHGLTEDRGDNDCMLVGHDPDILRWAYGATNIDQEKHYNQTEDTGKTGCYKDSAKFMPPMRDYRSVPGGFPWQNYFWRFGSPHAVSIGMVFCDGSVHALQYDIEGTVHARLASRKDGQMIPHSEKVK